MTALGVFKGHEASVNAVTFSSDGLFLASASGSAWVRACDDTSGSLGFSSRVRACDDTSGSLGFSSRVRACDDTMCMQS